MTSPALTTPPVLGHACRLPSPREVADATTLMPRPGAPVSLRRPLRSAEYLVKRCYLGVLTAIFDLALWRRRRRVAIAPGPLRVLVLRDDMVGDMVLGVGMLQALRRAHPEMRIDLLVSEYVRPVVQDHPAVDRLICVPRRNKGRLRPLLAVWRAGPYDVVIDAMITRYRVKTRSIFMMLASRAPWRIGMSGMPLDFVYNAPEPMCTAAPHVERMMALTRRLTAHVDRAEWHPRIPLDDLELRGADAHWHAAPGCGVRLLVNLSASNVERRWPDASFAEVLAAVRRAHPELRLIVIGLAADRESVESLATRFGGVAVTPTLRQLFALVATADAVITPDTAVAHMATAWERPVVTLMRAGYLEWTPTHAASFPVYGPSNKVIAGLTSEQVLATVWRMLQQVHEAQRASYPRQTARAS